MASKMTSLSRVSGTGAFMSKSGLGNKLTSMRNSARRLSVIGKELEESPEPRGTRTSSMLAKIQSSKGMVLDGRDDLQVTVNPITGHT